MSLAPRSRWLSALTFAVAAATPLASADAQWSYSFNGFFNNQAQTVSFTVQSPTPLVGPVAPSPCSITPAEFDGQTYSCATSNFTPNGFGTGLSLLDFGFNTVFENGEGGGGAFYFFEPGIFAMVGVHNTVASGDARLQVVNPKFVAEDADCTGLEEYQCNDIRNPYNYYGSAGEATLTVRGPTQVPEPTSAALTLVGLSGLAAFGRRRTRGESSCR